MDGELRPGAAPPLTAEKERQDEASCQAIQATTAAKSKREGAGQTKRKKRERERESERKREEKRSIDKRGDQTRKEKGTENGRKRGKGGCKEGRITEENLVSGLQFRLAFAGLWTS